jgi:hypothetical protein
MLAQGCAYHGRNLRPAGATAALDHATPRSTQCHSSRVRARQISPRGDRAARTLEAGRYTDGLPRDRNEIALLIADLCHLAQRHGWDIRETLVDGLLHYGSHCLEQAWNHDVDWNDELSDDAHLRRALQVLAGCKVPESLRFRVCQFMDLVPNDEQEAPPDL